MGYQLLNNIMEREQKTTEDFLGERKRQGQNVNLINLGCARNLVDAQAMLGQMKRTGHAIVDIDKADVAVVNTCAFIEEAKQESIDTILDLLELKRKGRIKKVIVAGCLAQRYGRQLAEELPNIDAIIGAQKLDQYIVPQKFALTPNHYGYLKICESCYNACSFCIIPKLKGKFISRSEESILKEVKSMDRAGIKEINIIGQDITAYGMDIAREKLLAKLLKKIVQEAENIQWIRLLYTFPAHVTDELIDTVAQEPKICPYIDMPLQHISDNILKSMNRGIDQKGTIALIKKIRNRIPNVSLRTTFIIGLPGETEENFTELKQFVEETKFEKMGAFVYSKEEGTTAALMPDQVSDTIKKRRMNTLMSMQKKISSDIQENFVGRTLRVMIDEQQKNEENIFLGRSAYDAPDVDGIVYVRSLEQLKPGDFIDVHITECLEYDLLGEVA